MLLSAYHAGLNDKLRSSVLDNWISSKIQVVVATVAFGYDCIYNLNIFSSCLLRKIFILLPPAHDWDCDVLASFLSIFVLGACSGACTVIELLVSLQDGMKLNYCLFKRNLTIFFFLFNSPVGDNVWHNVMWLWLI